ncbi:MAG: hypothetical protein WCE73_15420 [Candidatus Angelobacter sp.]
MIFISSEARDPYLREIELMPLRTSWRDIGRLLLYGLLCAAAFFGAALIHWFVIPGLPISPAARSLLDYLLILPLMVLVHLFWKYALEKATPNPYRRSKRSIQ